MLRFGLSLAVLAALAACGGGGGTGTAPASPNPASLSVHLAGGPGDAVQSLQLSIQRVELYGPQGWVEVAAPATVYSLLPLVDGTTATLAGNRTLAAGAYTALRLVPGPGSTVQLAGGGSLPLTPAAPMFQVPLQLAVSTAPVDLVLVVDPGRSVQPRGSGPRFAPELRAVDRNATGTISGRMADAAGQPLAGVPVTAQAFTGSGDPILLRRAATKADGTYTLDLIPFGTSCHAVGFPRPGGAVYDPVASPAFTPQAGNPSTTFSPGPEVLHLRADLSSTSGRVAPIAADNQGDEIQLRFGPVLAGGIPKVFVLGTMPGSQQGGVESWSFLSLPAGSTYQLVAVRRTWGADGSFAEQLKFSEDYGFLAGMDFPYDFHF